MPLNEIGTRAFVQGQAVATLSYAPLMGRAGIVRRFFVDKPSAADTWVVSTGGREVGRFDVEALGNQQPLSGPASGYPKENDIFEVFEDLLGEPLIYPVPQGMTLTLSSVGGATANLVIVFQEVNVGEVTTALMNHPTGTRFVSPVVFYRAGNVTAAGISTFDTEIKPAWFPQIFLDGNFPAGFTAAIVALFTEGGGRNTFSGAADHQSTTTYIQLTLNGQLLWTRASTGGIPVVGQGAAAGSANTVIGADTDPYPAFQLADAWDYGTPLFPIVLREGFTPQWRFYVTGDVTGGATYAAIRQLALVDLRVH